MQFWQSSQPAGRTPPAPEDKRERDFMAMAGVHAVEAKEKQELAAVYDGLAQRGRPLMP